MNVQIRLVNLDAFRASARKLGADASRVIAGSLYRSAERVMTVSKQEYVPVEKGILRSSGHVEKPVLRPGRIEVILGYGGPAKAYALVQHERLDFKHKVGQAKYLERPLLKNVRQIERDLVNDVNRGVGRR
jgi:hypothetical protein